MALGVSVIVFNRLPTNTNKNSESSLNNGTVESLISDNSALYPEQRATTATVTNQGTFVQRDVTSNDHFVDDALDNNAHLDVRDYFSKPMPVWSGSFSTQVPDNIIYSADLFTLFNSQDIWYQKVKGYLNFRGTVRLRLVANPTPFQAGLLRMSYFPCENVMTKKAVTHTTFRMSMSQLPGVYLPLTKNEATLCIPYVAPTHYIELSNSNRYSWGRVYISVFQGLRTGTGPTSVNLTLWMSIENAEVSGQILPQMDFPEPTHSSPISDEDFTSPQHHESIKVYERNEPRTLFSMDYEPSPELIALRAALPKVIEQLREIAQDDGVATAEIDLKGSLLVLSVSSTSIVFKNISSPESFPFQNEIKLIHPQMDDSSEAGVHRPKGKSRVLQQDNPTRRLLKPKRGQNPVEVEANKGEGPVSKFMSTGIKVANALHEIPILQPLMGTLSWAMNAARGAALAVGWSKPTNDSSLVRVVRSTNWYSINAIADDSCQPLSLMVDNRIICTDDAADRGMDEMSINYIKGVSCYFQDVQWVSTVPPGQLLYQLNVCPFNFRAAVTDTNVNPVTIMTPIAYLADLFEYYRGSVEIKFKLIKTGYHTGALCFTYIPGVAPTTISLADTAYPYRVIFDIQTGDEISFTLPYMNPRDYIRYFESMGRFYVHVVNPLINPTTVASTIDLAIFVKGGDDLEFQFPTIPIFAPIVPQGVDVIPDEEVIDTTMGATPVVVDTRFSELCIGEHIMSLLQLGKAFWSIQGATNTTFSGASGIKTHRFYAFSSPTGSGVIAPTIGGDLLSFLSAPFAFYRGSIRYRFCDPVATGNVQVNRVALLGYKSNVNSYNDIYNLNNRDASQLNGATPSILTRSGRVYATDSGVGALAIQAPFYNGVRMSPNAPSHVLSDGTFRPFNDIGQNQNAMALVTNAPNGVTVSRAFGDDFQFTFFLGIPYMFLVDNVAPVA